MDNTVKEWCIIIYLDSDTVDYVIGPKTAQECMEYIKAYLENTIYDYASFKMKDKLEPFV